MDAKLASPPAFLESKSLWMAFAVPALVAGPAFMIGLVLTREWLALPVIIGATFIVALDAAKARGWRFPKLCAAGLALGFTAVWMAALSLIFWLLVNTALRQRIA